MRAAGRQGGSDDVKEFRLSGGKETERGTEERLQQEGVNIDRKVKTREES